MGDSCGTTRLVSSGIGSLRRHGLGLSFAAHTGLGEDGISAGKEEAAQAGDRFASAYRSLRSDGSVQFNLTPVDPPPQPPQWLKDLFEWLDRVLKPVADVFKWLNGLMPDAPYARILLWTMLAVLAASLLWLIYRRSKDGGWGWRRPVSAKAAEEEAEPEWVPEQGVARQWLEEADALASQGRFAEAIHHLLIRSVEDIARRRPRLVQPAVTSRELAAASAVPASARGLFLAIALRVEQSLFGGRPVSAEEWSAARRDYADFALAKAWQG